MENIIRKLGIILPILGVVVGCGGRPGREGDKVFLALGVCRAGVFLIFSIVVKGTKKIRIAERRALWLDFGRRNISIREEL